MHETSDRAIILHLRPYQETDAILTVLTENEGKMTIIAKGLRGQKSKRKGTVRPFSCLKIWHTIPKNDHGLGKLTKSEFEFAVENSDPVVFAQLSLLAEVSERFLAQKQNVQEIFDFWKQFLKIQFQNPRKELCYFLVRLFTLMGLFPRFQNCMKCEQKFLEGKQIVWENGEGLYCCETSQFVTNSPVHKELSFAQLKILNFFQQSNITDSQILTLTDQESKELLNIIFQEISAFSEKPFTSRKVFEELCL